LAIDESNTFMKVAADNASVPHTRTEPVSGCNSAIFSEDAEGEAETGSTAEGDDGDEEDADAIGA